MIELLNYIDHEVVQVDEGVQTIYSIPFFADPISRYALVSVIKKIGYQQLLKNRRMANKLLDKAELCSILQTDQEEQRERTE